TILVRLPALAPPVRSHDIRLQFQPDESDSGPSTLTIAAIGLVAHGPMAAPAVAPLNLGQTVHFNAGHGRAHYLVEGWASAEASGIRNLTPEAVLTFRAPEAASDMRLLLDLATVHDPVPGVRH